MDQKKIIEQIGEDKLNLLVMLFSLIPGFEVAGSISLLINGIIDRKVGDIDLNYAGEGNLQEILQKYFPELRDEEDEHYDADKTWAISIGGVDIHIFEAKTKTSNFTFQGWGEFPISDPSIAIKAKKRYVDHLLKGTEAIPQDAANRIRKHWRDLQAYEVWEIAKIAKALKDCPQEPREIQHPSIDQFQ